jgi:uncharacterized protein YdhG (YjbR/CyaY superfamily)
MIKRRSGTVDEYISAAPAQAQKSLKEIRQILKKAAPKAKEGLKWGSPVFEEKRILFAYTAFKTHLNFMPTRSTLEHFKNELKDYVTGKDTIKFRYDKPLPKALIKKIAAFRIKEVREEGALWMHSSRKSKLLYKARKR